MKEYFSHDYTSRTDPKIKRLIAQHGMAGYGIFWAIIEDLYANTNVLPSDYDCIAFDLRTTPEIIDSIINDFGLFINDGKNISSISVERRLDERKNKSLKARESVNKRWEKYERNTNVLQTQYDSNTIKEKKRKEKEIKEYNNTVVFNFKKSLIEIGVTEQVASDWMAVRKTKKATNTQTAFDAIKKQIEISGHPANTCISHAVTHNWAGFKAEWMQSVQPQQTSIKDICVLASTSTTGETTFRKRINGVNTEITLQEYCELRDAGATID